MAAGSKSVRCPTHGYYYNPDRADGCVECVKDDATAAPPAPSRDYGSSPSPRRFSLLTALVWVSGLAFVGVLGYRFVLAMAASGDEIHDAAIETHSRLDPEAFRAPLESIESLVFDPSPDAFGQGSRIQRAAIVLFESVMARAPQLLAARHGQALVAFGARASQHEDAGFSTIDMSGVQRDWIETRNEAFRAADWFRAPD